jgi:hypothetical protein
LGVRILLNDITFSVPKILRRFFFEFNLNNILNLNKELIGDFSVSRGRTRNGEILIYAGIHNEYIKYILFLYLIIKSKYYNYAN